MILFLHLLLQDGSDESSCSCDDQSQWTCDDGTCVTLSSRCDGQPQCEDQSDELDCPRCSEGDFRCSDNTCLQPEMVCNDVRDCVGGEDELNCSPQPCSSDQVACAGGGCGGHCDQRFECSDGSDELNCCLADQKQFHCRNNDECVDIKRECDGTRDCSDGSDEHSLCGKFVLEIFIYVFAILSRAV